MAKKIKTQNRSTDPSTGSGQTPAARRALRQRAEAQLRKQPTDREKIAPAEARRLLHELEVHQIELEMQNEELRRAQEELEESRAKYFDLYDLAPVGYLTINEKGIILEANLTAAKLLGVEKSQLVKKPVTRFIVKEDQDIYYLHRQQLFQTRARQTCELRMVRKGGIPFWVNIEGIALQGGDDVTVCRATLSDITERKQTEEALRESEEKFRLLSEASPFGIYAYREKFVYVNPAFEPLTGYTVAELLGMNFWELVHPDSRDLVRQRGAARLQGEKVPDHYEIKLVRKDGDERWIDAAATVVQLGGEPTGIGILADITARKRAEEALRESESRLRQMTSSMREAIWLRDTRTLEVLYVNPAYEELWGRTCESLYQDPRSFLDAVHPEDKERVMQAIQKQYQGIFFNQEYRIIRPDGSVRWIWGRTFPIRDEAGQLIRITAIAEDITERKRTEETLAQERNLLRTLIDHLPDSIWVKDTESRFVMGNLGVTRHVGAATPEEIIGKSDYDFYPKDRAEQYYADEQQVVRSGQPLLNREEIVEDQTTGKRLWNLATKVPLWNAEGNIIGLVGIGHDITERKRAEETLRQRLSELEAVHTVSAALRAAQTLDEALPIVLDQTLAALETDAGTIWLYHPASGELRVAVNRGWFRQLDEIPIDPGEGIAGTVFASGKPHLSAEFAHDPLTRPVQTGEIPAGWGGACVPIRTAAETVGVLFVSVPLPRQITPEQMKLLDSLAEMAGAALQRMRLYEETVRHLKYLQALHEIDRVISASFDLRMTLNLLVDHVIAQLEVDAADVLLLHAHRQTLDYAAGQGFRTRASKIPISGWAKI